MINKNIIATSVPLIAEAVISISLAIFSEYLGSTRTKSITIGVFTFITTELVRVRFSVEKIRINCEAVSLILNAFKIRDPFSELVLLYGLRSLHKISSPSYIQMDLKDVWMFWRDSIARTQTQYLATSYALPSETWGREWATKTMMSIQQERLSEGCKIERLFIMQSEEEKQRLNDLMNKQVLMGIDVYWVYKEDLLSKHYIRRFFNQLGTLDYAVIDNSWIIMTRLDKQRKITGSSASKDSNLIKIGKELLLEAKGMSKKLESMGEKADYS